MENHSDDLSFFRDDDKCAVIVTFIAEHGNAAEPPLFKIFVDAPFLVFAGGVAFLLCIRAQERQHKFSVRTDRVDILLFKINIHPPVLSAHGRSPTA